MNGSYQRTTLFDYYLIRKKQKKHITISIDSSGTIKISAPLHVSLKELDALLLKKAPWIDKHLTEFRHRSSIPVNTYATSDVIPYLGVQYPLVRSLTTGKSYRIDFNNEILHIKIPNSKSTEDQTTDFADLFKRWYIQQGHILLQETLPKFTKKIAHIPQKAVFKEQKRRWGSCSRKGNIYLNWRLMMAPLPIIEYVLIHELAHLVHFNHSKSFWSLVETLDPNYRERMVWLKENGSTLSNWQ